MAVIKGTEEGGVLYGLRNNNDTIFGYGGNDDLYGFSGDDTMYEDTGDDDYHVESAGDMVIENANEGKKI